MESVAQKKQKDSNKDDNVGEDRISELPEDVKVHILSFLPTIDAINTMLLRSFGNLWTQLSSFSFDAREIIYTAKELLDEYEDIEEDFSHKGMFDGFASYVRNVLLYHKRIPMDEFELEINVLDWLDGEYAAYKKLGKLRRQAISEIRQWIRVVVEKEVKVLKLGFYSGGVDGSVLSGCVFTSKFLVKLYIHGCIIKKTGKVFMESLKELSLERVEISNEVFMGLISGCPCLEFLGIKCLFGLNEIRVNAPKVESLIMEETSNCLLDCPKLKDLVVIDSYPDVVDVSSLREVCAYSLSEQMVGMFCNVEVMRIHTSRHLELENLEFPQNQWKRLHIESPIHESQVSGICKVLRSSPHLEELKLFSYPYLHTKEDCKMFSVELFPACVMPQLQIVSMKGYKVSCHGLVRYAEFLLKSAVNLEKLEIFPGKKSSNKLKEDEFVKKLSSFSRASTNAIVLFDSRIC